MMTREEWLHTAARLLLDEVILPETIAPRPPFRVSCGWPEGRRSAGAIGVCYRRDRSADGHNEIFVSPNAADAALVIEILLHELIHAVDDCRDGHKGRFAEIALKVGFQRPLTTRNPNPSLEELCRFYAAELGEYPHAQLQKTDDDDGEAGNGNRQLKLECGHCGIIMRASRAVIKKIGVDAACPACGRATLNARG